MKIVKVFLTILFLSLNLVACGAGSTVGDYSVVNLSTNEPSSQDNSLININAVVTLNWTPSTQFSDVILGVVFFILTRAALPRYRYDQLMHIGWKSFLPLSLGYLLFTVGLLTSFNWLPN